MVISIAVSVHIACLLFIRLLNLCFNSLGSKVGNYFVDLVGAVFVQLHWSRS
jgi:hypothetical protein